MIEKIFVKEGIKKADVEEFLAKKFEKAGYSHTEISRTPLGTRIVVYAHRPGIVVGRSGRKIREIAEEIKQKFGFENPMLDVREVENPFLDAKIVAQRIAKALERGIHYKKVANYYLNKVMEAGAIGVQIRVAGKLAGVERSRFQKFKKGFIVHSGEYSETLVDKGYAQAMIKPGVVGVQVEIMREMPKELLWEKGLEGKEFKSGEEIEKQEEVSEATS
ncbi:MAG: 30S ribosomal protein S3 [Candidatus Aenigmatarchaeota archaeon]|nr:MAG: 30S ribosomal protein S3 [Candidatus Aenigmarchaeota archaeon]